jgi:hypothetical protein
LLLLVGDVDVLAARIRNGEGRFVGRESGSRTVWLIHRNGVELKVVYQRRLGAILTVYAPDMPTRFEKRMGRLS